MVKLFGFLALLGSATAGALGVQDVEVGQPLNATPAGVRCSYNHCRGVIDVLTFGGILDFFTRPDSSIVDDLTLETNPKFFDTLAGALTAKYGKPTSSTVLHKQNAFGAQVNGRVLAWVDAEGTTAVLDEFGTLRDSILTIRTKQEPRKSAGI